MDQKSNRIFETTHRVQLCVVGGGVAGLCAAVTAARMGLTVALMHDRPVLGGNASSEIRMWIRGARGCGNRETGLLEEISLENLHRNPLRNWSIWDSVLFEKVRGEKNITLLLNCSCNDVKTENNMVKSVRGWQTTTYTWHTVEADYFADCSGDSIVASLSGAAFRIGREGRDEFGERLAPEKADGKLMGSSLLISMRDGNRNVPFTPPDWAYEYPDESIMKNFNHEKTNNFWWIETGGETDTVKNSEEHRDELMKIAYGVFDHLKNTNREVHKTERTDLDWVGALQGKRESLRCEGDYILTQNDIQSGAVCDDICAYGGWPIDDHPPAGFLGGKTAGFVDLKPYAIPYRCLYSKNIENLFFAGRNISASHVAFSSTRVMGTCGVIGQAVGAAAAVAAKHGTSPRGVYEKHMEELQTELMEHDCFLPGKKRVLPELTLSAKLGASCTGVLSVLQNGEERPWNGEKNFFTLDLPGGWLELRFGEAKEIKKVRAVFDSDLERESIGAVNVNDRDGTHMLSFFSDEYTVPLRMPDGLVKDFSVDILMENGEWEEILRETKNRRRLFFKDIQTTACGLRLRIHSTWGNEKQTKLFDFSVS